MTRFDATTPDERRALVVDAVAAHRERDSPFCTLTTDAPVEGAPPWVQVGWGDGGETVVNCDCTDADVERLNGLLDDYPAFTVVARESPDDMPGTNVRVAARGDDDRLAAFVDALFVEVYGLADDYRLWAVEI